MIQNKNTITLNTGTVVDYQKRNAMKLSELLSKSYIQFLVTFLVALTLSIGIIVYYVSNVTSGYEKLLLLYITPTIVFTVLGTIALLKFKRFFVSLPLFILSFTWFFVYVGQIVSGADLIYDYHLSLARKAEEERKMEERTPQVVTALINQGAKSLENMDIPNAKRYLFGALEIDTSRADIYFVIGDLYNAMNRPDTALTYYHAGLRRYFEKPEVHFEVGELNLKIGELDVAIQAFGAAAQLDPSNESASAVYNAARARKENERISIRNGMVRVRQIVLRTKERAEEILKNINNGSNFGAFAYRYSIDPLTRLNGGHTKFFDPQKKEYAFIGIVKTMRIGQVSKILQYEDNYYIIKRVD